MAIEGEKHNTQIDWKIIGLAVLLITLKVNAIYAYRRKLETSYFEKNKRHS